MIALWLLACAGNDTNFNGKVDVPDLVSGTAVAVVDPVEIVISDIDPAYSKGGQVTVRSAGDADLNIYGAQLVDNPDGVFFFQPVNELVLTTGNQVSWTVVATLPGPVAYDGLLRVRTNDPNQTNLLIPVHARPLGWVEPQDTASSDTGANDTAAPS